MTAARIRTSSSPAYGDSRRTSRLTWTFMRRPFGLRSVQVLVLVVLGALCRQLDGQAVAGELVEPHARRDRHRTLVRRALVACFRGGGGLRTELPSGVDEVAQRLVVLEHPDQLEFLDAEAQARL